MRDDLTTLDHARTWLKIDSTTEDGLLQLLLSGASRQILGYLGRGSVFPRIVTHTFNGLGGDALMLRAWPVLSIAGVSANGLSIPANASAPLGSGFSADLWDGTSLPGKPSLVWLSGYGFGRGMRNVSATYTTGYRVTNEAATIPSATPYSVTPQEPMGTFGEDAGVTFTGGGAALTSVGSNPSAGEYAVDAGSYVFAAADAGKGVLLSYGFIPPDIEQACFELVGEQYRYRSRIGEVSRALQGGGSVSYMTKAMSETVKSLLQPYRNVVC